jgi:hypothetical protein
VLVNLVVPEPTIKPGDYNRDDVVTTSDYVVWRKMLGQIVPRGTSADGDGNGIVEMADLNVWQGEFGEVAPGGGSSPVPEPSAVVMLLVPCACCRLRRRRLHLPRRT